MLTERAWACRLSASPSAMAASASARNPSGPHFSSVVRFMKSSTPSPEEKRAERAVGQHMVRPADIIADGFGRVMAEEDRSRIGDARGERLRIGRGDFEMLRRELVHKRERRLQRRRGDDGAEIPPACAGNLNAGQGGELCGDGLFDSVCQAAESVIRMDCAKTSCSACAKRSAATQSGLAVSSASTRTSEGPAIMSMPTVPNTRRLAAAT